MGLQALGNLGWEGWLTLGTLALVLGLLMFTRLGTDVVIVAAVTLLLVTGVLEPQQAFSGLANEGIITIGVLYAVVAGVEATGATTLLVQNVLRRPKSTSAAMLTMMAPVAMLSSLLNNTPVVAMFLPVIRDWARKHQISVSKLMIPLSYAAVLGGVCTLIGTSTNLIVSGLVKDATGQGLRMFDVTWVGVPCCIAGIAYVVIAGRWLLPDRRPAISELDDPREYTVEMMVEPGSALVGKTVEEAGLRQLPGVFLVEIDRGGEIIPAVSPREKLAANDRLVFAGVVSSVVDLQKTRGLVPATNQVFKLGPDRAGRVLIEAVVSDRCPIVGQTIRDGRFRSIYNAVVIAVARSGERVRKKIGDIVLRAGDTLLLEARPSFVEQQRNSHHFYLVSRVENSNPLRHEKAWTAVLILLGMVLLATFEVFSMLEAAMLAAGAMLVTRCCRAQQARRAVEWPILITIAGAFALGKALESTGVARLFAESLIDLAGGRPWLSLLVIYAVAVVLTELVSHAAAAVLVFTLALETAHELGVSIMPFAMAVTVAASLGFATPLGYQTHMMVYGPGGYRFTDFLRIGIPLDILCMIIAGALIPIAYPF